MFEPLLTFAAQLVAAAAAAESALPEALRISGIGLVAIFFVMGLFGAMIKLLTWLFPEAADESV
jgi:hypothetical protein